MAIVLSLIAVEGLASKVVPYVILMLVFVLQEMSVLEVVMLGTPRTLPAAATDHAMRRVDAPARLRVVFLADLVIGEYFVHPLQCPLLPRRLYGVGE